MESVRQKMREQQPGSQPDEGMLSRLAGIGRSVNGDCIFHPRMLAKRASAGLQLRRGYSATPQVPDVLEDDH